MLEKFKTLPELGDVSTDQQSNAPLLSISINRDATARFGIQPQVIDDTLNDAFGQRQVAQYFCPRCPRPASARCSRCTWAASISR